MYEYPPSMGNKQTLSSTGGSERIVLGRIDQYELHRELGGGAFGTVFLATDTTSDVNVAVKGLPPILRNNREEMERVRKNFALVSRLHHPNIASALVLHPVHDVRFDDPGLNTKIQLASGDTLMVMEYAPGVTLSQWRKQFPGWKVPPEIALDIAAQIASALDFAHERGIIHRDVKPANIMVETTLEGKRIVRVLDFGLAAEIRSSTSRVSMEVLDTSGTRPYMAPEQWLGHRQGPATDQYSLAVVVYEMLSGEVPFASVFDTGDPVVMMNAVGHESPDLSRDLPEKMHKALTIAMSKTIDERFVTCGDLIAALNGEKANRSHASVPSRSAAAPAAKSVTVTGSGKGKAIAIGAAALLALALGAGAWYAYSVKRERHEKLLAEVCLLEAKAGQASEKNATAEWRGVEFFRDHSKELEGYYRAGKQAMAQDQLDAAKDYFLKVRSSWYWLSSNATARASVLVVRERVEKLRTRCIKLDGESADRDNWRLAEAAFKSADLDLKEGAFPLATEDFERAERMLGEVAKRAEAAQVVKNTAASKVAFKEDRYADAFRLSMLADPNDKAVNFQLGFMYMTGKGVDKDEVKGLDYYRKAEKLGNAAATRNIGLAYEMARAGLTKDLDAAFRYYERAVAGHDVLAQQFLANMYEFGKGTKVDLKKAREYYAAAVRDGQASSKEPLARVERRLAAGENTAKAIKAFRAKNWTEGWSLSQNADREDSTLQFYLGVCYDFGFATAKDKAEAAKWYRKAADNGDSTAMFNLGNFYRDGTGVAQDYAEAMRLYRKADEKGDDCAIAMIGDMYAKGQGVEKDLLKAVQCYRKGVAKGDARAHRYLALAYEGGKGVDKDEKEAARLYTIAMEKGDNFAKAFLAELYENGKGVEKNLVYAKKLYREAAAANIEYAIKALKRLDSAVEEVRFPSDVEERYKKGLEMMAIDPEATFRNGPVVYVSSSDDLVQMIKSAQSGTTFRLGEGNHQIRNSFLLTSKNFRIVGVSPQKTILQGETFKIPVNSVVDLRNLTAQCSKDWGIWFGQGAVGVVRNCAFRNSGLWCSPDSRVLVSSCDFSSTRNDAISLVSGKFYVSDINIRDAMKSGVYSAKNSKVMLRNANICAAPGERKQCGVYPCGADQNVFVENVCVSGFKIGVDCWSDGIDLVLNDVDVSNCDHGIDDGKNVKLHIYNCRFSNVDKIYGFGKTTPVISQSRYYVNEKLLK